MVTANLIRSRREDNPNVDQTKEVAVLPIFAIGSYLNLRNQIIAVVECGFGR